MIRSEWSRCLLLSVIPALAVAFLIVGTRVRPADWTQFRGPDRRNTSTETGLLKEWPKEGPPLLWKVTDLGSGYAPVSVAEGRLYTMAFREEKEYAVALDRGTGKEVWATHLGAARQEGIMAFLFQRQPVVDGERLYAFTANAQLCCLDVDAGRVLWKKDYQKDFQGRSANFGWNDSPLVDGDHLICSPGGKSGNLIALNKRTGEVVWTADIPGNDTPSHPPVVAAEIGGVRQYLKGLSRGLVAVAAKDGKFLWRYDRVSNGTANATAPVVIGDQVFITTGFGVGCALLNIAEKDGNFTPEEVYFTKEFQNMNGGVVLLGDHVYGSSGGYGGAPLVCLEWKTGKVAWKERGNFTSVLLADGHLLCHHQSGHLSLIEATPKEYKEKSRFLPPDRSNLLRTYPVLSGGKLYVRDQGVLLCYDLRADRPRPPEPPSEKPAPEKPAGKDREPDAVFVPSPQDVVEKMLAMAKVKKTDAVYDLGCGDGRIVVTAARKYGCRAIGVDLDAECIKLAKENVTRHKVGEQVTIKHEDIFRIDLSEADVVTLYLLPTVNAKLIPQLEKMKPGARIVSHAFPIPGVKPDKVIQFVSGEDDLSRPLYLFTMPLQKENKQ